MLDERHVWAVVLAGGDGTRLKRLTRSIAGDGRPKQFCSLLGSQTLLGDTRGRLAGLIPPQRTLLVVSKTHRSFYANELADIAPELIVAQPANKGTATAIAYSLLRIARIDPDAVVSFFPADHYYDNDAAFLATIEGAYDAAIHNPGSLVLLGAKPYYPEVEYGWIEPRQDRVERGHCVPVKRFWEKPSLDHARDLFHRGCLWNTFVMCGRAGAFLEILNLSVPHLLARLGPVAGSDDPRKEDTRAYRIYRNLEPVDFSRQVLSLCASIGGDRLLVLPLGDVWWSDLGTPERVMTTLAEAGIAAPWVP